MSKSNTDAWGKQLDACEKEYKEGHYENAEKLARSTIEFAEKNKLAASEIAVSYNDLSAILLRLQRYDEAANASSQSLELYKTANDQRGVALACVNLSNVKCMQKDYPAAEKLAREALAIREKILGPDHEEIAICLSNIGNIALRDNRLDEAKPLFDRALAIARKNNDSKDEATIMSNIGSLLRDQKDYPKAEELFTKAIAQHEKLLGTNHPTVAEDLLSYSKCLKKMGRDSDARAMFERAKQIHVEHKLPLPTDDLATVGASETKH